MTVQCRRNDLDKWRTLELVRAHISLDKSRIPEIVALLATPLLYHGPKSMDRRGPMRHANRERLEAVWQVVAREPGIRAGKVARRLEIPRSSVTRALAAMDEAGLLLSEDGRGRLWPWERKR
jgi:DNA-binding transcriptional ArsR family regulator